ncbi:cell adhesion molecule 3-like [Palaemon carinicauda]|uniref:cell adhesion molecule 3-like n=1 Tax=Palaemon carinicauda TaxID=392227 RepID=UPI0035B61248
MLKRQVDHESSVVPWSSPSSDSYLIRPAWLLHSSWSWSSSGDSLSTLGRKRGTQHWKLIFCLVLVLLKTTSVLGIRVIVPQPAIVGQNARLQCLWQSENIEVYSIRWYKNGEQFYSFIRGQNGEKVNHKMAEMEVDLLESDETTVTLRDVKPNYEGIYRCEVMGNPPLFRSRFSSANLTVMNQPQIPVITGFSQRYRLPDTLRVNCTTHNSRPEALISFYVNGKVIHQDSGRVMNMGVVKNEYLDTFTSSSQLTLPLSEKYVPSLTLTCRAQVKGFDINTEQSETAEVYRTSFFPSSSKGNMESHSSMALVASAIGIVQILQGLW